MKFLTSILSTLLCIVMFAQAQTADDIIQKNISAKGGADKMKAVQSFVATGKFSQSGLDIPFTMTQKRPHMFMIQATFQGKTQVQAFDGTTGWTINPFSGRDIAEKMDADALKEMKFQADIDGPLVDYASKGYKVEYVGQEDMDGSPTYHLKLTTQESDTYDFYLDKDSYLEVKEKSHIKQQDGTTQDGETNFSNYKETSGVLIPYTIENASEYNGQKFSSFINIDSVKVNASVADSSFTMPSK
jgi:outer membrane lipoprotein-sorting protein